MPEPTIRIDLGNIVYEADAVMIEDGKRQVTVTVTEDMPHGVVVDWHRCYHPKTSLEAAIAAAREVATALRANR